jgi:hypothetical protein
MNGPLVVALLAVLTVAVCCADWLLWQLVSHRPEWDETHVLPQMGQALSSVEEPQPQDGEAFAIGFRPFDDDPFA